MELIQHPLSAAFPAMSAEEFQELKDDIEAKGQREPVIVLDDMVLDGWHRYRACSDLCLPVKQSTLPPDEDPVAFVLSHNLKRRHLTPSQRAVALAECQQWAPAGRPKNVAPGATFLKNKDLAIAAGVSKRTIANAKTAVKAGLAEAVKAGKLTVKQAAARATSTPAKPRADKSGAHKRAPWDVPAAGPGESDAAEPATIGHEIAVHDPQREVDRGEDKLAAALGELQQVRAENEALQGRIAEMQASNAAPARAPGDAPAPEEGEPELAELAATERDVAAELEAKRIEIEALRKITQADDKLAAALAELEQQRAENSLLTARNNDLLAENAKLVKQIKLQGGRNDALLGEMAKLMGQIKALQSKLPACYGEDLLA